METDKKHACSSRCFQCHILCRVALAALAAFLVAGIWGIMQYAHSLKNTPTMTFSGSGKIVTENTIAEVSFTFSDINTDVTKAREVVSGKVADAYSALKKMSVDEKDIQTTRYNIYPEYDYVYPAIGVPGKNVLRGYRVSHTTRIHIRNLEKTGDILDAVTRFKPTNIDDLSFTIDEKEHKQLEEKALAMAIRDAKTRARRVAQESGMRLKKLVGIHYNESSPYYRHEYASAHLRSADSALTTPIAQGENTVTVSVSVTYEVSGR